MNSFKKTGFTLVELIITVIIVGILSIVSVNAYKVLVMKAVASEGVALMGAIARAERLYYGEHGRFYGCGLAAGDEGRNDDISNNWTNSYFPALGGIDARSNKYFKSVSFHTGTETELYVQAQSDHPYNGFVCVLAIYVSDGQIDGAQNIIRVVDTGHNTIDEVID